MKRLRGGVAVAILLGIAVQANGQTMEDFATNNKLFLETASKALKWEEPTDPVRIVGPLYFVGTKGLSSWLFATTEGHILLNTECPLPAR